MTMMFPLVSCGITLTEVPGKTSLFLEMGNCTVKCKGCHSPHLTDDKAPLVSLEEVLLLIRQRLKRYPDINCVVLMGGVHNTGCSPLCIKKLINTVYKELGIPCALYSGLSNPSQLFDWLSCEGLQYLKIGNYCKDKGGLESPTTNQQFYKKESFRVTDRHGNFLGEGYEWVDETKRFWKGV